MKGKMPKYEGSKMDKQMDKKGMSKMKMKMKMKKGKK